MPSAVVRYCVLFAVLILVCSVSCSAEAEHPEPPRDAVAQAPASKVTAEEMLLKQNRYFQQITSLSYAATTTVEAAADAPSSVCKQTFIASGRKYCVKMEFGTSQTTLAFDGVKYQSLNDQNEVLLQREPPGDNPYRQWHLITLPYAFVFAPGNPATFDTLRNPHKWTQLIAQVTAIRDDEAVLGHTGCTLTFRRPSNVGEAIYEVFFAEDKGYLPIYSKCRLPAMRESFEITVTGTTSVDTQDGGKTIFPSGAKIVHRSDAGAEVRMSIKLKENSLAINTPIPDDVFRLSDSEASGVSKADQ